MSCWKFLVAFWTILIILSIVFFCISPKYVAWYHGSRCYIVGQEPHNIKYRVYYSSFEECKKNKNFNFLLENGKTWNTE